MSKRKKMKLYEEEEMDQSQFENEEIKFLKELETKIRDSPLMAKIVSSFINPSSEGSEDKATKDFKQQELHLFGRVEQNINQILLTAVKYGERNIVEFFINCGVNVNVRDDNGDSAADCAWTNKNYKILLLLLKSDSFFPVGFNLDELSESDDDAEEIRNLVKKRDGLHEVIKNGFVEDVKNFKFNETSKLYLNTNNESAGYVALKYRKFEIYAYLKSIGSEFGKDEEKSEMENLKHLKEKAALNEAMVRYFPKVPNAHIYYLISKSRSHKPVINLTGKLQNYYNKLDTIPEVSLILKVVQYVDYLDVIFDFDEDEVSKVYPLVESKECSRGETLNKIGRIYIAASWEKRKREEILGTIAHELTHMAMQILYENDCNPYGKGDEECVKFFKDFKDGIRNVSGEPSKILLDAIDRYPDKSHHYSELIVRIPHILAQYNDGRNWLEENIPTLVKFYKERIEPKCREFLEESALLKPKSVIKSINENVGEITTLKNCNISFTNASDFVEDDGKKVFVYKVESTLLGTLKVLQRLYGKCYSNFHGHFLVLKLQNFVRQLEQISQALFMAESKWLIIEVSNNSSENELNDACLKISSLLDVKPFKKILFVSHLNMLKLLRISLRENHLLGICEEILDEDLNFENLDDSSQKQILGKTVTFQGKQIDLGRLIQTPELYKFINPGLIEDLLQGRKVNVGNEILGVSSLEGPYSDIIQQMDFGSFVGEIKNSRDIFILRTKPNDETTKYINSNFEEKWISMEFFKSQIFSFERKAYNEKIYLVNDRFRSEDFKNFCRINPGKKCHLIDVTDTRSNSFTLQEIYNPDFYVKRKVKKIFIKMDKMKRFVNECQSEAFIFSNVAQSKRYIFEEHNNVKYFDGEEADENFKILSKPGNEVHWFKMEADQFTWKNSYGSLVNIRNIFKEVKANEEGEEYDDDWECENTEIDDDDEEPSSFSNDFYKKPNIGVLEEEKLASEILHKKILLISDNPGTGKTTTLTKLYEDRDIANTHWIIRINLKDYLKTIRDQITSKELDMDKIIRFLQDMDAHLKNELNENLLKEALTHENPKCLLLAFDGYDEILDEEDREKLIDLLKFLKNETLAKIWITSRLQYKEELEYHLGTFALEFDPFDDAMKKKFVEKYLKDRLSLILKLESFSEEKISAFAEKLLSKMKQIFKKDITKFVGTPLQLNLVMFGSLEYFTKWIAEDAAILDFNYLGDDVQGVYENFIKQKYELYFKKCNIIIGKRQKRDKKIAELYHKDLAESLIYERRMLAPEEDDKELNLLIGLIQSQGTDNFEFIHFTFREFYFAQTFADYIITEKIKSDNFEKITFLFKEVFVKREFEMIRNFFNIRFKSKIPEENLEELKNIFLSNEVVRLYTTLDSGLAIAAQEGYENNFNFFYTIYNFSFPGYEVTNILNRPLFSVSAIAGRWEIWESLFVILENVQLKKNWEEFYYKCLISESARFATETKSWKLTKSLLTKIDENFWKNEMGYFFTAIIEKGTSADVFELLLEIGKKLFTNKEQYGFLVTTNKHGPNALFAAAVKKDPKFMEILLGKIGGILTPKGTAKLLSMKNDSQGTILHAAAWAGRLETAELIFNKARNILTPDEQCEFLMATDQRKRNALCNAVYRKRNELTKYLIEKGVEILKNDPEKLDQYITIADNSSKTILHLAIQTLGKVDLLQLIFQEVEKIFPKDKIAEWMMVRDTQHGSVLHMACYHGDAKILHYVLKKAKEMYPENKLREFLMLTNYENYNPLHLVAIEDKPEVVKLLFQMLEKLLSGEDMAQLMMMKNRFGTVLHEVVFWYKIQTLETFLQQAEKLLKRKLLTRDNFRELIMTKGSMRYHETTIMRLIVAAPIEIVKNVWKKIERVLTPDDMRQLITEKDKAFPNLLYAAVSNKNPKVMELIFDKIRQNLNEVQQRSLLMEIGFNNRTYLQLAVVKSYMKSFGVLFDKMKEMLTPEDFFQILINRDLKSHTVLHQAVTNDEPDLLKLFLEKIKGIPIENQRELFLMTTNSNENALNVTVPNPRFEIVKLIFEHVQSIFPIREKQRAYLTANSGRGTIFHLAADATKPDLLHFLLEKSKEILTAEDLTEIITQKVDYVPYFLRLEPEFSNTILHIAAFNGKPEIIRILFKYVEKEHLTMTNGKDQTSLHAILSSCYSIEQEAVKILLEKLDQTLNPDEWHQLLTAKDNIYGSILHSTALINEPEIVKLILEKSGKKLQTNGFRQLFMSKDEEFGSVLQAALYNKDPKVAKLVLDKGKEILDQEERYRFLTMKDKDNRTALHVASSTEEPELKWGQRIETALPHLTKVNCLNSLNDRTEFVYFLLKEAEEVMTQEERKQFFSMKDNEDKTALHVAAQDGKLEAVKLLLQEAENIFGEDLENFIMAKDSKDQTALDLSSCTNNYLIKNLLNKFTEEKFSWESVM